MPISRGWRGTVPRAYAFEEGWCERIGSQRALRVTERGRDELYALGVPPEALRAGGGTARREPTAEWGA